MAKKKRCEVIQRFRDKNTQEIFNIGDIYEGEAKRIKELQSMGYLSEEVKENESSK